MEYGARGGVGSSCFSTIPWGVTAASAVLDKFFHHPLGTRYAAASVDMHGSMPEHGEACRNVSKEQNVTTQRGTK